MKNAKVVPCPCGGVSVFVDGEPKDPDDLPMAVICPDGTVSCVECCSPLESAGSLEGGLTPDEIHEAVGDGVLCCASLWSGGKVVSSKSGNAILEFTTGSQRNRRNFFVEVSGMSIREWEGRWLGGKPVGTWKDTGEEVES